VLPKSYSVACWAALGWASFIGLCWILGENHSAYGDEPHHLDLTFEAARKLRSIFEIGADAFLIGGRYPPLFHYLGAPWVLWAADPILAGRVFAVVVSILAAGIFFRTAQLMSDTLSATCAFFVLMGCGWYLEVSRYYYLEGVLGLELILLLRYTYLFLRTERQIFLLWLGLINAVGMLTKFNFLFYSLWLLAPVGWTIVGRNYGGKASFAQTSHGLALLSLPTLLLAVPWYLLQTKSPVSAAKEILLFVQIGTVTAAKSFFEALDIAYQTLILCFSAIVIVAAATIVLVAFVSRVVAGLNGKRIERTNSASLRIVAGMTAGLLVVPIALGYLGLSATVRWNLEFLFLPIILAVALSSLPVVLKAGASALLIIPTSLAVISANIVPLQLPDWVRPPMAKNFETPNWKPVGLKEAASDLARFEAHHSETAKRNLIFFAFHEHRGVHAHALRLYLRAQDSHLTATWGAFYDLPLDLFNIFDAGFLAIDVPLPPPSSVDVSPFAPRDPELRRYRRWLSLAPETYWSNLQLVSDINGRFGHFRIFFVPGSAASPELIRTMLASGKVIDGGRFEPFWDAQELYWRTRIGDIEPAVARERLQQLKAQGAPAITYHPVYAQKVNELMARLETFLR
jgi:hypothetical protein